MKILRGYSDTNVLYRSAHTLVYRAFRNADGKNVIIKTQSSENPPASSIHRLENEYHNLRLIHSLYVPQALEIMDIGHKKAMVMQDIGGRTLEDFLATARPGITEILQLASWLCDAVGDIHRSKIIHAGINPSNIIINHETRQLQITDFDSSLVLEQEIRQTFSLETSIQSLAYISPEQTGRMNRAVDFRTDFYSMGVVFFRMLTGKPPFEAQDSMELLYSHIARLPDFPRETEPRIPEMVRAIVMKLLAKNAEDRYQSARGIKNDLDKCRIMLDSGLAIKPFPLAEGDSPEYLRIPEKLYGRESEIKNLEENCRLALAGGKCTVLISGQAGIGKSFLVNDMYRRLPVKNTFFISGKYTKLEQSVPYSTFIQSCRDLIRQVMAGDEHEIRGVRDALCAEIGEDIGLLVNIIPELKKLKPDAGATVSPDYPPPLMQMRIREDLQKFLGIFGTAGISVIMFQDDLQWADSESIALFSAMMGNDRLRHFLLIGSYRDNDAEMLSPCAMFLKNLAPQIPGLHRIAPSLLSQGDVRQFLEDTFGAGVADIEELSAVIHTRTGGNPFFVRQFIHKLYHENYIEFRGGWQIDIERINKIQVTDNLVSFMVERISRFPGELQEILRTAACIGVRINLELLSRYFSTPRETLSGCLTDVMREGMVIMHDGMLHFAHDRIQESLYSVLDVKQKADIHYRLGKLMHSSYPASGYSVFDIADQLFLGRNVFSDPADHILAAEVNHAAGMKAKGEAAFSSAHEYFNHAFALLPPESFQTDYRLSLSIVSQLCEAGFLTGNIAETERYFTLARDMARDPMDTVHVHQVIIEHYTQGQKAREGLEIGRTFLASLGHRFPKNPLPIYIIREILTARIRISGRSPADIRSLPVMNDTLAQAVTGILLDMGEASFIGYPEFFPLITSRIVNLSLKMGNSPASAYAYVTYGWMIMSVMGDIQKGFSIAETGLNLAAETGPLQLIAKTYFIYGAFVHPWKHSFSSAHEYLWKAVNSGSRYGDYSFASYALNHTLIITYCSGENLKRVIDLYKKYQPVMKGFQKESSIGIFSVWEEMLTLLSDRDTVRKTGTQPIEIRAGYASEAALVEDWKAHYQLTNLGFLYTAKLILGYLLGKFDEALEDARKCEPYLGSLVGCVLVPDYFFYHALVLTAKSHGTTPARRRRYLASARACERKLRHWAKTCPENFGSKHALVVAELVAAGGRSKNIDAVHNLYERAKALARDSGLLHEEAIACNCQGAFALASGDARRSDECMLSGYRLYGQWDAGAKLACLEAAFPAINFQGSFRPPVIQTSGSFSEEVDTRTILKATHAISGEIYLGKLLPRLLSILIENTGAQRGFLLLEKETRLVTTARYTDGTSEFIDPDKANPDTGDFPATIINYVKHTLEPLLVAEALSNPVFGGDPYVQKHRVKSALCMPLMRQEKLFGIILLENNILTGAFTPDRFELVKLLSTQAIISIENSLLFQRSLATEQLLLRQYEESRQQYGEMEKLHEELEHESELLSIFKKLADASGQGLFMADLSHRVTYFNAAFRAIIQVPDGQDLSGNEFLRFYDQDATIRMDTEIIPAVITLGQWTGELKLVTCEGETVDVLQNMFLIRDNEGNPHHLASVITDLTDRKRIEDELRKTSKIESLGVFAGGLAHDFNNYLTAITANLSFLKSTRKEPIDPEILDDVLEACDRAKNLTLQLLAFSKGGTPVRATCQIRRMLAKTANFVLAGSGIKCITDIPEILWEVFVDQSQISQVVHNIVLNARQVLDDTGTIIVRAENAVLPPENEAALAGGRYIRISIQDSGPGIQSGIVENIFDPYFTTKKTGSGLGLTISYSIIKKHDGHLLVHSRPGEGTTFVIYLPVSAAEESLHKTGKPADMRKRYSGRVLVMDDEPSILAVADNVFSWFGFSVTRTHDGAEAVREFREAVESGNPFRLLIMDLTIPGGMGGKDTIRLIRGIDPAVKALASSGYSTDPIMAYYHDYGFDGVLNKPYRVEDIAEILANIFPEIDGV